MGNSIETRLQNLFSQLQKTPKFERSGELSKSSTQTWNKSYGKFDSDFFTTPGKASKTEQQIGGLLGKLGTRTLAQGSFSKGVAAWEKAGSGTALGGKAQGQYDIKVGELSAKGQGSIGLKDGAFVAQGSAEATAALLNARASGRFQYGPLQASGEGYAFVGAQAKVNGNLTIDPKKGIYGASVGGEAFVGAKAGVSGEVNLGKFGGVGGRAEAWAGIGAQFKADIGYKNGKFQARVDIGAALGIGFKLGFNVNIDVKGIVDKAKEVLSKPIEVVKDIGKSIGNAIKKLKFW